MSDSVLSGRDDTQVKLMQERCILVDTSDKAIGEASKKECHLLENIEKGMTKCMVYKYKNATFVRSFIL